MSNTRIPAGAGTFAVVTVKRPIRGKERRCRVLVFTTHDGFVGESRSFRHVEAYEAAVAERASAVFKARESSIRAVPTGRACSKPAPAAPLLQRISEHLLIDEVIRRGFDVSVTA